MLLGFGAGEGALLGVDSGITMANSGFARTGRDPAAATPPELSCLRRLAGRERQSVKSLALSSRVGSSWSCLCASSPVLGGKGHWKGVCSVGHLTWWERQCQSRAKSRRDTVKLSLASFRDGREAGSAQGFTLGARCSLWAPWPCGQL